MAKVECCHFIDDFQSAYADYMNEFGKCKSYKRRQRKCCISMTQSIWALKKVSILVPLVILAYGIWDPPLYTLHLYNKIHLMVEAKNGAN